VLTRRAIVKSSALSCLPLMQGVAACGTKTPPANPKVQGRLSYKMPLESARHERTFMQWPSSLEVYSRPQLRQVQSAISLIANTIAKYEPVVLLAGHEHMPSVRASVSSDVQVWDIATEDLWCRDCGPTFVKNQAGDLAIAHIVFNGWGNKQSYSHDGQIAPRLAQRLGLPLLETGLVGEQGRVEHDGNGLVLAHASSWANPNRNRLSQNDIGDKLLQALGGAKMIWAPGLIGQDITDYHIDALARFVAPSHVLIQLPRLIDHNDPWSVSAYETYEVLKMTTDLQGNKLKIDVLFEPTDIRARNADFVASYVNYYVCNDAVISAQFGDTKADGDARDMLATLYPDREIVALNVDPLGAAGGGIHCATQQQPTSGFA
jgi:agmatine deiminase